MSTKSLSPRTWVLIAAIGPIAFGSTYWVTQQFLSDVTALWGAALRALPAGLLLLLVVRRVPRGAWWWKSAVLGSINMGLFFSLLFVSAQLLPSSVAASIAAAGPLALAGAAWLMLREKASGRVLISAVVGLGGVLLIVGTASGTLNFLGIGASLAAMALMSVGAILTKKWDDGTPVLTVTSWQLLAGGVELLVLAAIFGGPFPTLGLSQIGALAYLSVIATALGFYAWFSGFRHLPAGLVGVIGLLNPVTGVLLGVLVAGEPLSGLQIVGILLVLASVAFAQTAPRKDTRLDHDRATATSRTPKITEPSAARASGHSHR